jgi:enamine deaminase RidA (YjgF/YER057c/UK114 family)
MTDIQRFGANPRMSDAVVHGGVAYLRGFVPVKSRGGSVAEQTADVLDQLDAALIKAGSERGQLLQVSLWMTDIGALPELNAVWDAWTPSPPPARACVEARLFATDVLVEVSAIAAV